MAEGSRRRRLTAEDWARAALHAIGEHGLSGVAVEPLAAELGATKGSFYWHFANRDTLISAALELWEETDTERVCRALAATPDPAARLREFFATTLAAEGPSPRVEVNLLAVADHPLVAPAMRRVVERRIDYARTLFTDLGFPRVEAARRALVAYSAYLGHLQLAVRMPHTLPREPAGRAAYLETILDSLAHP